MIRFVVSEQDAIAWRSRFVTAHELSQKYFISKPRVLSEILSLLKREQNRRRTTK